MIKRFVALSLVSCAVFAAVGCSEMHWGPATQPLKTAATPVDFKTLKGAYAGKFLIGTAADPGNYSDAEQANIKAQYNIITPENCMKPQPTHPSEGTYNFAQPDALVKFCEDNNIKVHGHTLAWHSQTAPWFFQPGADGKPVTRELGMERLKSHIMTVVGRYKGRILSWDVVNEAINDVPQGQSDYQVPGENLRQSNWVRTIGPDYLPLAFKWAHEADPGTHLYYNDYSIEGGATQNNRKHAASMALLKRLKAEGAPIYGVGIQGHWHLDTNLADIEKAIENYESLGLKISVTELDVTATGTNSGAFNGGGGGGAITEESYKKQAEVYAKMFDIFNRHAASIERITLWGMSDRRSWRSSQMPLLFTGNLEPKPAFQAVLDVAQGKIYKAN